ncbi:MAG: nucleotidyltransferase domain-containing protein, partial [Spirochaetia bacterium]|nr:nucleotidyltransferase domain-containing protein [Spirochaetia bacterium]
MLTHDRIREVVLTVAQKYAISKAYLFGSHARGDATEDSDYDFHLEGGNLRTLLDLAALRLDLEDALGKSVDIVFTKNMEASFYDDIKDEEVLLLMDANKFAGILKMIVPAIVEQYMKECSVSWD